VFASRPNVAHWHFRTQTFKEYPPSQTSGTFGIEKALKMIEAGSSGGGK
jgi:hypothetical protein